MKKIVINAMAKINLGLDVLRRRENGYHDVKMIMQTVNIYDTLEFEKRDDEQIVIKVDAMELPTDENNLIYKATKLLFDQKGVTEGVDITLTKRIPIAAGMAGGSTDAAAALVGINRLFELGFSVEELKEIGVKIGADVPYCIEGGTALSEGIGEILTKLPDAPDCFVVVAKPEISVSTKYVYENLHANELKYHPDIDGMVEAIKKQDLDGVCSRMENVLETVTETKYPIISEIKNLLKEAGAENALMSGSGPTVFAIFKEEEVAKEALEKVVASGLAKQSFVTVFAKDTQIQV
ncbi:MAG: 4-(cytidine 5'-diphospho)-2-C-methyl-D-erythritol kinase [Lachnospiraceae bacterium]|nr:4-(cytidine 5'-diphospho)-2-C-methyl-D-erythritol kinase [Lachnospiraceae bacterium]